jgi:hypothetical protein
MTSLNQSLVAQQMIPHTLHWLTAAVYSCAAAKNELLYIVSTSYLFAETLVFIMSTTGGRKAWQLHHPRLVAKARRPGNALLLTPARAGSDSVSGVLGVFFK